MKHVFSNRTCNTYKENKTLEKETEQNISQCKIKKKKFKDRDLSINNKPNHLAEHFKNFQIIAIKYFLPQQTKQKHHQKEWQTSGHSIQRTEKFHKFVSSINVAFHFDSAALLNWQHYHIPQQRKKYHLIPRFLSWAAKCWHCMIHWSCQRIKFPS